MEKMPISSNDEPTLKEDPARLSKTPEDLMTEMERQAKLIAEKILSSGLRIKKRIPIKVSVS